jgi:hypothetical protein
LRNAFIVVNNGGKVVEIVFIQSRLVANCEDGLSVLLIVGNDLGKLFDSVSRELKILNMELSYLGSASRNFLAGACRTG